MEGLSTLWSYLSKELLGFIGLLSVSFLCVLGERSLLWCVGLRRDLDLREDRCSLVKGDLWLLLEGWSSGGCCSCWPQSGGVGGFAFTGTSTGWLPCWSPCWSVVTPVEGVSPASAWVSSVRLIIGVKEDGSRLDVDDVNDSFKDSAMFSNFLTKAAPSRSPRAVRSMPVTSGIGAWGSECKVDNGVVSVVVGTARFCGFGMDTGWTGSAWTGAVPGVWAWKRGSPCCGGRSAELQLENSGACCCGCWILATIGIP